MTKKEKELLLQDLDCCLRVLEIIGPAVQWWSIRRYLIEQKLGRHAACSTWFYTMSASRPPRVPGDWAAFEQKKEKRRGDSR